MQRFKTVFLAMVAVMAIGAVSVGTASAAPSTATTFSGTLEGNTWIKNIDRCGFSIDIYSPGNIGAGQTATAEAASFTGQAWASYAACDTSTTTIETDFDIEWDAIDDQDASIIAPVEIKDKDAGCTYTTKNDIGITSDTDEFGTWAGSGSAKGDGFCALAPATITVRDGEFS